MRKWILLGALAATVTTAAMAADGVRERAGLSERATDRRAPLDGVGASKAAATLVYGFDPKQRIDLYRPAAGARGQPLILYVHGGGWAAGTHRQVSEKPRWASRMGLWFGSIGYRYLPDAPVETQATDVGAAIRKARADAPRYGYDANRIILMGHSAGAHLAALVATDPKYAGDAFAAIKAVIPIDAAGYDVAAQMKVAPWLAKRMYIPAFGTEPARQKALSPITHAGGRDAPRWLLIHVVSRDDAAAQSNAMAAALRKGGATAEVQAIPGTHMTANRDFGKADYPAQAAVDALVRAVVG